MTIQKLRFLHTASNVHLNNNAFSLLVELLSYMSKNAKDLYFTLLSILEEEPQLNSSRNLPYTINQLFWTSKTFVNIFVYIVFVLEKNVS